MNDLIVTFVLFVVALVVFHALLFTRWRGKSIYFWKATDYIYYAIAMVSLATVALRYQQDQLRSEVRELEGFVSAEYDSHQAWILALINTELQDDIVAVYEDPENIDTDALFDRHDKLTDLQVELASLRPYTEHLEEIAGQVVEAADSSNYVIRAELDTMITETVALEEELSGAKLSAETTRVPNWILQFMPFFLAPALALRITRVAAESYVQRLKEEEKTSQ